jgi:SAM-dependent methyltransferase
MRRAVEPELLDELPSTDPGARGARRDLRKVNAIMGNARIAARTLLGHGNCKPLTSVVELGAGDGTFALAVARRLGHSAARRGMVLVDRRPCVQEHTREALESLSWNVEVIQADALEWLDRGATDTADVILANLFLHHFQDSPLSALLRSAARRTKCFLACEPLRSHTALWAATMLPMIGCNRVTLHDARISVRAGFRHRELSSLWPADPGWRLIERRAGLFTHHFAAQHA